MNELQVNQLAQQIITHRHQGTRWPNCHGDEKGATQIATHILTCFRNVHRRSMGNHQRSFDAFTEIVVHASSLGEGEQFGPITREFSEDQRRVSMFGIVKVAALMIDRDCDGARHIIRVLDDVVHGSRRTNLMREWKSSGLNWQDCPMTHWSHALFDTLSRQDCHALNTLLANRHILTLTVWRWRRNVLKFSDESPFGLAFVSRSLSVVPAHVQHVELVHSIYRGPIKATKRLLLAQFEGLDCAMLEQIKDFESIPGFTMEDDSELALALMIKLSSEQKTWGIYPSLLGKMYKRNPNKAPIARMWTFLQRMKQARMTTGKLVMFCTTNSERENKISLDEDFTRRAADFHVELCSTIEGLIGLGAKDVSRLIVGFC